MFPLERPSEVLQRLGRLVDAVDARGLRVTSLKVSRTEHSELCRIALAAKWSFITFRDIPLQVVRE